jgi:exoribonuclease R
VDFAMQRLLLQWMRNVGTVKTEADLSRVLETTAYAWEVKRDVERGSRRYWLLKYLEAIDSDMAEGVVVERLAGGVIIGLLGDQLRTFVATRRERNVDEGDRVRVQVDRVSARRNELAVSIVEKMGPV